MPNRDPAIFSYPHAGEISTTLAVQRFNVGQLLEWEGFQGMRCGTYTPSVLWLARMVGDVCDRSLTDVHGEPVSPGSVIGREAIATDISKDPSRTYYVASALGSPVAYARLGEARPSPKPKEVVPFVELEAVGGNNDEANRYAASAIVTWLLRGVPDDARALFMGRPGRETRSEEYFTSIGARALYGTWREPGAILAGRRDEVVRRIKENYGITLPEPYKP